MTLKEAIFKNFLAMADARANADTAKVLERIVKRAGGGDVKVSIQPDKAKEAA